MSFEMEIQEQGAVELDNRPTITSSVISLFAAFMALIATAPFSAISIPFSLAGILFIALGLFVSHSEGWVSIGMLSIFLGIVLAGLIGTASLPLLLVAIVGLMVSWDVGQHAITIGNQLGRSAPTQRGELIHAAASCLVGVLAAGAVYTAYLLGSGRQPVLALVLVILGVSILIWSLRE